MILRNITVINLGAIEHFSCDFEGGLNVLGARYADELSYAIRVLLNHKDIMPLPQDAVRADSQILAKMFSQKAPFDLL